MKYAIGALGCGLLYAAGWMWWPPTAVEPMRLAMKLSAWPSALVALMVLACSRALAGPDAKDPLAAQEPRTFKINQRVLSNTVEQLAIFLPSLFAMAAVVDASHTRLLPLHVTFFCVGRVAFWGGYHVGHRSYGFNATIFASVANLGWWLVS